MLGFGIFLIVIGAIIAWAVPALWQVEGVDWTLIGYILLAAGALMTIIGIVQMATLRRSSATTTTTVDPSTGSRIDHTERRDPGV